MELEHYFVKLNMQLLLIGTVTLSPMPLAPVCRVGDPLQLTCAASAEFMRWNILQVNDQGTLEESTTPVQINSRDDNQIAQKVMNSSTFTFTRTSTTRVLPLISMLSIDSVSIGLNGTVVNCSDVANPMISSSTTIYIISAANSTITLSKLIISLITIRHSLQVIDLLMIVDQYTPSLHTSEEYGVEDVTVTVEWTQQVQAGDLISYTVIVSPSVPIIYNGNTSLSVVLEYNVEYILSVEAAVQCESNATAFIALNYGELFHARKHHV